MKVLHICSDFTGTKVHANLFKKLDGMGLEQVIYTFVADEKLVGRNSFEAHHTQIFCNHILNKFDHYLFHVKMQKIFRNICKDVDMKSIDVVNATTLLTGGAQAYKLFKKYRTPYIVQVRNTDVNIFLKKAPHTWLMAKKVLLHASKIVFIAPAMHEQFKTNIVVKSIYDRIKDKVVVQYNGIDDYWIDHLNREEKQSCNRIVYIGRMDNNKNVVRLIDAFVTLQSKKSDLRLTIIGGGGEQQEEVETLVKTNSDCINYLGPIYDKDRLFKIYQEQDIFAMPSISETFGLVYIEALTQNLRLLYTKGQGVDGVFEGVGEAVDPLNVSSITEALDRLTSKDTKYEGNRNIDFEEFRWDKIARNYISFFEETVKSGTTV